MLKQIFKGKSVILVTHRIGLLSLVDRIVYIQDGDIKEDGTHTELMMQRAEYYKFYNNQAKWYR